jgi:sugar lactone lactonase YvrE
MSKVAIGCALLLVSSIAAAGPFHWATVGPFPVQATCQPYSFNLPDSIAVDKSDDIYIANEAGPNAVEELTVDGDLHTVLDRRSEPIRSGDYYGLRLAIGAGGNLYMAVKGRGTVERLNANGTLTIVAGKPGDFRLVDGPGASGRLKAPNAIAIDRDIIYVADTRTLRKITPDGAITTLAGRPIAKSGSADTYYHDGRGSRAIFMSPNGIAVGAHGNLYVADGYDDSSERQGQYIGLLREVTPAGVVRTSAGNTFGTGDDADGVGVNAMFSYTSGVARDSLGELYVSEPAGGECGAIRKVDTDGGVSTVARGECRSHTDIKYPSAIATNVEGIVFVIDDPEGFWGIDGPPQPQENWLHRIKNGTVETLCKIQQGN